jgi:arginase
MSDIQLLVVPYDSGHRDRRMGLGPEALLRARVDGALRATGHAVDVEWVESETAFQAEVHTTFELHGRLAGRVAAAVARGRIPVTLSGNCGAAIGAVAGLALAGIRDVGVVWLDAHGEFNTPDSTESGFIDGMGLATLTGRAWATMAARVPGFRALPAKRLLLVGTRELDRAERALLEDADVPMATAELINARGIQAALGPALDALAADVRLVYLHVDVDVLDPAEGRGNAFAPPGGLTAATVLDAVRAVRERFDIVAAGVASYDPACDARSEVARFATRVLALATD